jgi:hypothetical protein
MKAEKKDNKDARHFGPAAAAYSRYMALEFFENFNRAHVGHSFELFYEATALIIRCETCQKKAADARCRLLSGETF